MGDRKDAKQQMEEFLDEIDIETRMQAEILDSSSGPFFTEQEEARIAGDHAADGGTGTSASNGPGR